MKKDLIQTLKILLAATVLSLGISYVYAWTAPPQAPPAGNTPAPLNAGDNTQYKDGNLIINNSATPFTTGLVVASGNVGIGTTTPDSSLSVVGNSTDSAFAVFENNTNTIPLILAGRGTTGSIVLLGADTTYSLGKIITPSGIDTTNINVGGILSFSDGTTQTTAADKVKIPVYSCTNGALSLTSTVPIQDCYVDYNDNTTCDKGAPLWPCTTFVGYLVK